MQLGPRGKTLLANLQNLFKGNHVEADDVVPKSELTETYTATEVFKLVVASTHEI
jgi:hypothetical protein